MRSDARSELADDALVPLFCSEAGRVTGPLVFCGYGLENAERGRDDFAGTELKDAIALIVRGAPPVNDSVTNETKAAPVASLHGTALVSKAEGWGASASIFTKVMNARRHGAIGVVLLPETTNDPLLPFDTGNGARAGIPALMVDGRFAQDVCPGYTDALVSTEATADAARCFKATVLLFADVVRASGDAYNVLGRLRGKDSTRTVVVGAHYDHLGRGGSGSLAPNAIGEIHNGADDNASGTATVLEIARLMKSEREKPDCDVIFALWSGEELGLLGSEHWAAHPTVPIQSVVANLNLDMVGRAGNGKLQVLGAGTSPAFAGWMKEAGAKSALELTVSTSGNALGGSSDHQSFLKRRIPALFLFSGLHADYHKPSDDVDKFEALGASKVAVLGEDLTERMASAGKLDFVDMQVGRNDRKVASNVPKGTSNGAKPDKENGDEAQSRGMRAWFGSIPSYTFDGHGVLFDGTSQGSPAERAGFLKGDVLIQLGEVDVGNIYDFMYALQLYKPGDVVLARFVRDRAQQEVRVTLASREVQ